MLQKKLSAVILSFSQSHYFYGELRPVPLLHLTYCNHREMRLQHELAGNISSLPAQLRVSLSLFTPLHVQIGTMSSASSLFWQGVEGVINRG